MLILFKAAWLSYNIFVYSPPILTPAPAATDGTQPVAPSFSSPSHAPSDYVLSLVSLLPLFLVNAVAGDTFYGVNLLRVITNKSQMKEKKSSNCYSRYHIGPNTTGCHIPNR